MITRRQGREWALQLLAQFDLNPPLNLEADLEAFWEQQTQLESEALANDERGADVALTVADEADVQKLADIRAFAETRAKGVWSSHDEIDARIEPLLSNWSLYRLGTIERSVLRLGVWELLNCPDIPPAIVVNESVDLAKFFSETKSGRFVNAVLDRFAKTLK